MPTRPPSPDPSGADTSGAGASAFGGLGAGLSFFQDWVKAAGSALPNMQAATQSASGTAASPWNLPTLDPEELDKRIQDLRTVQFWLEQNARLISMTIQGLEVQRMTLTTLRGMNVSMDAVRDSLKARAAATAGSAFTPPPDGPAPEATAPSTAASSAEEGSDAAEQAAVNPLRWWDTLTQQFSNLANQAVQAAQATAAHGTETSATAAAPPGGKATAKPKPKPAARKTAKRPARQAGVSTRKPPPDSHSAD